VSIFKVPFTTMAWDEIRPGVRQKQYCEGERKVLAFATGDGLFIPAGALTKHRAVSIVPGTRLLMVEDA
jgi:hypothetical protein